jgi:hypothetical protein
MVSLLKFQTERFEWMGKAEEEEVEVDRWDIGNGVVYKLNFAFWRMGGWRLPR